MSKLTKSCQEAFEEGQKAYWFGKQDLDSPYDIKSDEHLSWNDGWTEAYEEDNSEPDSA